MKFGVFCEHQLPRPWLEHSEYELLAAQALWKQAVLKRDIVLEELDTTPYDLYSHQNEDIVRESPAQLKARRAAKDAASRSAAGDT